MDLRFLRFVIAGGTAAAANFVSRILLSEFLAYVPAIVIAYCIGMTTAFVLNRLFVFTNASNGLGSQAFWFILVNVAAVVQTVVLSVFFARVAFPVLGMSFYPETVAHAIGVVVPVFTSYLGHRRFSFRAVGTSDSDGS